jgi:hypothetical protein
MIFLLNKFVHLGKNLEEKVLGSYYTQMEEINKESGMEVYNLDKKGYTQEELRELKEYSIY